jgi:hypothetical protein
MSDQKKPTDAGDAGKELDADQLENVSGGLMPAPGQHVGKFFRPNPTGDGAQEPPTETVSFVFHKID